MQKPEFPPKKSFNDLKLDQILELLNNDTLLKQLAEIEKKYPYWDKFKQKVKGLSIEPEILWSFNKIQRTKAVTRINFLNEPDFQFMFNTPAEILKYLHEFDLNLGGQLESSSIIPREDKNRFLVSSIMEEAIASSQLEGAVSTREAAKEMLKANRKPRNQSERMILNNYLTIKKIHDLKNLPLTKDLILEIHSIIAKDTLDKADLEGTWRSNNDIHVIDNLTGEVAYTPPDYKRVNELMDAFCKFANSKNEKDFIHPIIRAIILHFLIGYIHPFVDGNGRTARAIFYWYLLSRGYWLIEFLSISRIIVKSPVRYAKAYLYTEYDSNDLTYFIHYNLRALHLAVNDLQIYINRKIEEKKSLFSIVSKENINDRQAEIIRDLILDGQKTLTFKEIQTKFDVAYQTARTDLFKLVELGYLREAMRGKKILFFKSATFEQKLRQLGEVFPTLGF